MMLGSRIGGRAVYRGAGALVVAMAIGALVRAADPATGKITMTSGLPGTLELKFPNKEQTKTFEAAGSVFDVSAGKYQLWSYKCTQKAADGKTWTAYTGLASRDDEVFDLKAGGEKKVEAGPPFKAVIKATKQPNRIVSLDLLVTGAGSDLDTYVFECDGKRAAAPAFVALDRNGKEVLRGSFQYG